MQYFFQDKFISTVKSLLKKNSYRDCEKAVIDNVFKPEREELFERCSGFRLNPNAKNPIVKLRIAHNKGKSGSYRLYFFVIKKKENLYFGHLYPKYGKKGKQALSKKEERVVIKSLVDAAKTKQLTEVFWDKQKNKICYCSDNRKVW